MNLALRQPMTSAEFLAWEDGQELRYEFDGVRAIAMTGGTAGQSLIQTNLATALGSRLRGKPCRFYDNDLEFLTGEFRVRYPDGQVVRGPVDPKANWVKSPTVAFEVVSPSTSDADRIVKALEYEKTPSVQRYVMLEQDRAAVVYARDVAAWTCDILLADAMLALPEIDVEFPLAELYEGLEFAAPGQEQAPGAETA